jgi:hypothetical protein
MPDQAQTHTENPPSSAQPPVANPNTPVFKRDEDFAALYANSVVSEHSVWDLKVIFGILDQSVTPMQVVQHTSINLPWVQVKLLSYYLNIAIAIQESFNGKIVVPAVVMPPDPRIATPPPGSEPRPELIEKAVQLWEAFKASLSEP